MASQQPGGASSSQAAPTAGPENASTKTQRVAFPHPDPNEDKTGADGEGKPKKRKHRGGKKKRNRRQSFAVPPDDTDTAEMEPDRPTLADTPKQTSAGRGSFYRMNSGPRSSESLESEALLDHREHGSLQVRRQSIQQTLLSPRGSQQSVDRRMRTNTFPYQSSQPSRSSRLNRVQQPTASDDDSDNADDRTPLMGASYGGKGGTPRGMSGYGGAISLGSPGGGRFGSLFRRSSGTSSKSGRRPGLERTQSHDEDGYDINNPPSVPSSPKLGPDLHYDDVMLASDEIERGRAANQGQGGDAIIDIENDRTRSSTQSPLHEDRPLNRRMTLKVEDDVCFPQEGMSEIGDEESRRYSEGAASSRYRRRRSRKWPELSYLEEWAAEEKEQRTMEGTRMRQVSEPLMVGGRLRPAKTEWHRQEDENPFRFTYFNEEFESTIHSQSISELLQPGQTFKTLFIPDPPVLSDSSSDEDEPSQDTMSQRNGSALSPTSTHAPSRPNSTIPSRMSTDQKPSPTGHSSGHNTPSQNPDKPKRYGPRPVFWLDVLCPSDAEMKVLSKAFGIHPLTAEDIMMQEAREKVELFRNYYFVNYRSFEQDANSEDYLEPVNVYVVVFREGVISFHFSPTPHPANVRRRIRQLSDYLYLTTDWISYAIIDDVTDAYAPLIERIEEEVDEIDELILTMHNEEEDDVETKRTLWQRCRDKFLPSSSDTRSLSRDEKTEKQDKTLGGPGGDMLRRTGEVRKKVMSLYRLLGNKADVIKGFAKRCTEQWDVAPRSEIGLYLGDIQDHIVTMTGNLSHYENLLSRAHSNYLGQINLRMNERAEKTNDVLGKLTVLGTIVLPMNIVTGLFGCNFKVPGQEINSLDWFWGTTGFLMGFGIVCYLIARRIYGIV